MPCMIQQHKNHRYVHNTFLPVCLFIYDSAHIESSSLKVISNTTIIKTEFNLEVRAHTKTEMFVAVHVDMQCSGRSHAQEEECARYRPPQIK